jgi:hypothetical protein
MQLQYNNFPLLLVDVNLRMARKFFLCFCDKDSPQQLHKGTPQLLFVICVFNKLMYPLVWLYAIFPYSRNHKFSSRILFLNNLNVFRELWWHKWWSFRKKYFRAWQKYWMYKGRTWVRLRWLKSLKVSEKCASYRNQTGYLSDLLHTNRQIIMKNSEQTLSLRDRNLRTLVSSNHKHSRTHDANLFSAEICRDLGGFRLYVTTPVICERTLSPPEIHKLLQFAYSSYDPLSSYCL